MIYSHTMSAIFMAPVANISVTFLVEDELWHIGYICDMSSFLNMAHMIFQVVSTRHIYVVFQVLSTQLFFTFQVDLRLYIKLQHSPALI